LVLDFEMSTGFAIRVSTPKDELAVSALLQASYPVLMQRHYDKVLLSAALPAMTRASSELLRSDSYYLAEAESGHLVGCGGWSRERPGKGDVEDGLGHIRHFAAHPNWIRRGVGRAIYEVCEEQARSEGVTCFECYSSLNAEGFYATLGFEAIRRMDVPLGPDLTLPGVLMRRSI
jgi:N-acetylglutamate synthase-like GNAT family acetyltransferase